MHILNNQTDSKRWLQTLSIGLTTNLTFIFYYYKEQWKKYAKFKISIIIEPFMLGFQHISSTFQLGMEVILSHINK